MNESKIRYCAKRFAQIALTIIAVYGYGVAVAESADKVTVPSSVLDEEGNTIEQLYAAAEEGRIDKTIMTVRSNPAFAKRHMLDIGLILHSWHQEREKDRKESLPHAAYSARWIECAAIDDYLGNRPDESAAIPALTDIYSKRPGELSNFGGENAYGVLASPEIASCWNKLLDEGVMPNSCSPVIGHGKPVEAYFGQSCPPTKPNSNDLNLLKD